MTDQEFFVSEMSKALDICRARARATPGCPESERENLAASFSPIETCIYGMLGTPQLFAMADALLTVSMGDWERFYRGYVDWTRSLPECAIDADKLEENARGAMLMALKHRIEDLERVTIARRAA